MGHNYRKVVIKTGTNVITGKNGLLDLKRIKSLVEQISFLHRQGTEIILVSSGAVGAGRSLLKINEKQKDLVSSRQILASVGQIKLINHYYQLFKKNNLHCAQILATKEDFRDRTHYLNMKNCFEALLKENIVPIVNENDVVSVTELMFTDNDELAGLISSMLDVDALIILTNVDGVYNGNPENSEATVIETISAGKTDFKSFVSPIKSQFGRGGMVTKCGIANKLSQLGITTHIANGKQEGILVDLIRGAARGTKFSPHKDSSGIKRWVAHSEGYEKGTVYINEGAKKALLSSEKANSLLPIGIIKIEGKFEKGEIIKICDEKEESLGLGMARYDYKTAENLLGKKGQKPLVHYDYLFMKD